MSKVAKLAASLSSSSSSSSSSTSSPLSSSSSSQSSSSSSSSHTVNEAAGLAKISKTLSPFAYTELLPSSECSADYNAECLTNKISTIMDNLYMKFEGTEIVGLKSDCKDVTLAKKLLSEMGFRALQSQAEYIVTAASGINAQLVSQEQTECHLSNCSYSVACSDRMISLRKNNNSPLFKMIDLPAGFGKTVISLLVIVFQYYYRFARGDVGGEMVYNKKVKVHHGKSGMDVFESLSFMKTNIVLIFSPKGLTSTVWMPTLTKLASAVLRVLKLKVMIQTNHVQGPIPMSKDPKCIQFILQSQENNKLTENNMQTWTTLKTKPALKAIKSASKGIQKSNFDDSEAESESDDEEKEEEEEEEKAVINKRSARVPKKSTKSYNDEEVQIAGKKPTTRKRVASYRDDDDDDEDEDEYPAAKRGKKSAKIISEVISESYLSVDDPAPALASDIVQSVDWVLIDEAHLDGQKSIGAVEYPKMFTGASVRSGFLMISATMESILLSRVDSGGNLYRSWGKKKNAVQVYSPIGMAFPTLSQHEEIGIELKERCLGHPCPEYARSFNSCMPMARYAVELKAALMVPKSTMANIMEERRLIMSQVFLYRVFIQVRAAFGLHNEDAIEAMLDGNVESSFLKMLRTHLRLELPTLPYCEDDKGLIDNTALVDIILTHIASKQADIANLEVKLESEKVPYMVNRYKMEISDLNSIVDRSKRIEETLRNDSSTECPICLEAPDEAAKLLSMTTCCGIMICKSCVSKCRVCPWCRSAKVSIAKLGIAKEGAAKSAVQQQPAEEEDLTFLQVIDKSITSLRGNDEPQVNLRIVISSIIKNFVSFALKNQVTIYVLVVSQFSQTQAFMERLTVEEELSPFLQHGTLNMSPRTVKKVATALTDFQKSGNFKTKTGVVRFLYTLQGDGRNIQNSTDGQDLPCLNAVFHIGSNLQSAGALHQTEGRLTRLSRGLKNDHDKNKGIDVPAIIYFNTGNK